MDVYIVQRDAEVPNSSLSGFHLGKVPINVNDFGMKDIHAAFPWPHVQDVQLLDRTSA